MNRIQTLMTGGKMILASMFGKDVVNLNQLLARLGDDMRIADGTGSKSLYPYRQSPAVFRAVNAKATAISSRTFQIVKDVGPGKVEVVEKGAEYELFESINPNSNPVNFFGALVTFMELYGDCFTLFENYNEPLKRGVPPKELWTFNPTRFQHRVVDGELLGWTYYVGGKVIPFLPDELLHIKYVNPYDDIRGLAPLEAARLELDNDYSAAKYTKAFYDNSAEPGGAVEFPGELTKPKWKEFVARWNETHQGVNKAHRIAVLDNGAKWIKAGIAQRQMQFVETREFNREQIMSVAFGVPPSKGGILKHAAYANYVQQDKAFWADSALPLMKLIEKAFKTGFFKRFGLEVYGRFDRSTIEALQVDHEKKSKIADTYWKMGKTFNEINDQLELGFESTPEGDISYVPAMMIPSGEPEEEGDERAKKATPAGRLGSFAAAVEIRAINRSVKADIEQRRRAEYRAVRRRLTPIIKAFDKAWKNFIYGLRVEVLDNVFTEKGRSRKISEEEALEFLFSLEKAQTEAVNVARPFWVEAVKIGSESVVEDYALAGMSLPDPLTVLALAEKELLVKTIIETLHGKVRDDIIEGVREGESIGGIAGRIKENFNTSSRNALRIARTEVGSSANAGRHYTASEAGMGLKKWLSALNPNTRDSHAAEHAGPPIPMDEPYPVTGLMYPMEYGGPPGEVINCNCAEQFMNEERSAKGEGMKIDTEVTEIRYTAREAELFKEGTILPMAIQTRPLVRGLIGELASTGKYKIQALRFPKKSWMLSTAKPWVNKHPDILKATFKWSADEDRFVPVDEGDDHGA